MASSPRERARSDDRGAAHGVVTFASESGARRPPSGGARSRATTMGGGGPPPSHEVSAHAGSRRLSMPQQRQASVLLSPPGVGARPRATSAAANRGLGSFDDRRHDDGGNDDDDDDDEEDDRVHNLTFDGVKEGPYMLCKRSDDLLGHRARQVFREKAASMRGENSIYYYLKELMKKFGSDKMQKKGITSLQIVLQPHEFRKLVASDAAFQAAIPEEHIDALFHRMVCEDQNVVRHLDFVEFCLFDHHQLRLLLFKFRKRLKKMRLTDNEITDTFRRLSSTGASSISSTLLHAAVARELDVVLTTGEIQYLMQLMDLDCDGAVKVNDFESFVKDDRASFDLIHPSTEHGIVELKITMSEVDELSQRREGFKQLLPAFHEVSNVRVHLWYKSAPREDGKTAITNIRYAPTSRDSELVAKGFTCLQQDVNRSGAFGKHKYIWVSYVPANVQNASEVIDMCLSSGDEDDAKDAKLWLPMHRGFKLVPGDLNERSSKQGVFLWIRRRPMNSAEDLVDTTNEVTVPDSPRTQSKKRMHVDELEGYVRQMLRRNCPVEQDGSINFARLFDEFDAKKARSIGKQAMLAGVESFGIKMKPKDFSLIWDRINPCAKKAIDVTTFASFLEMTDSDIDEVVNTLQRAMTVNSTQQQQMPNYRLIFQSYNSLGDGRLSRADFQRLLSTNQINFTNTEMSKVIQRLDVNKDGIVDYSDFLRYVTGVCDAAARRAQRVAASADNLKAWAMEKQNKKLAKDGQIDSSASWKLLRPKRGILDMSSLDHVLRERGIRLEADQLRLLRVLMSPGTNGEINQAAYHAFVNHQPRKLSSMIYDVKKVAGSIPDDGEPDGVYDRLNIEGNGRLSLVTFAKEVNVLSAEKNTGAGPFDLKDFVYIVQWTGADCGGDGAVLIDRFLAAVRDNNERRNMKHEFVTNYDSPTFIEGVKLLREEMRRCAKTPDGKFDYRVPFRLFDKDKSGQIVLSEFEAAIRELGVDKYLVDREVKSLMRRFDLNSSGGIGFEEFLRFNLAESSIKTGAQLAEVEPILNAIIIHERLTPATVSGFCSSLKRMFSIIDKDTHGVVPATEFVRTLRELGIIMGNEEMETLADVFAGDGGDISYTEFCDSLQHVCERSQSEVDPTSLAHEPVEVVDLLCAVYREYHGVRRVHAEMGKPAIDLPKAFGFSAGEKQRTLHLTTDELKEILWACGVHHPFLREELESIQRCFRSLDGGFNGSAFCNFMEHGPAVLFRGADDENGNVGVLDGYISRLQEAIQTYMATGGKDAEERLFRLFDEFDEDGSGSISNEEFVHVLHKAGLRRFLRQEDEELLLQFLDTNGDGVISYREFVDFAKDGERRLNTIANQFEHDGDERHDGTRPPSLYSRSPGPSPPRSPRPPSPSGTVRTASPGRAQSSSPRALPSLILSIARLNAKLRPPFPFDKYVYKYRISTAPSGQALVKGRVFEKIIDKFLARLIENSVAYNMHELDADSLTRAYETPTARPDGAPVVNCDSFLTDLKVAHARVTAQNRLSGRRDSDSSDDYNGELSCSSDEGESKSKRAAKVSAVLNESIRRDFKSKSDQEALRAKVKAIISDLEKGKKESKASDSRVFKMLAGLGLRLKKKEAETLLGYLNVGQNGGKSGAYDLKKLAGAINEQLGVLVGDTKKQETSSSSQAAPAAAKKESHRISDALVDKMYRCFIAAAQQNISGRKLLEKCDTQKTGMVTVLELQTVLRLMGCVLSESELGDVKAAFSGKTAGSIDYRLLVRQLTSQMKPPTLNAPAAPKLQDHRPAPIQTAPMPPPLKSLDDHHRQKPVQPAASATSPPPRPLTLEESKRLDALVRPYFQDLLKTRRMDTESLLQAFEPYDLKGSGFAAPDALHSVLRKYDVWLTEDMARNVLQRYTSPSSGKFDYVEFSTSLRSSAHDSTRETSSKSDDLRSARSYHPQNDAPEPVQVKAPKLPELDSIKLHHQPDRHRASSSSLGWSCPVCLHTQTRASSTSCEICAAQNPASVQYETLLKCSACEFRNRSGSTHCDLCRLPLSGVDDFVDAVPSSPQKSKSNKPANLRLQIPSTSLPATATAAGGGSYDEGWLA